MGTALLVGGVIMWIVDATLGDRAGTDDVAKVGRVQATVVGLGQVVAAVFPGMSRSMSTIAGGQLSGMTRATALEFSFFLAIPTMTAAFGYDLLKTITADAGEEGALGRAITGHDLGVLVIGFVVSFFVAWAVIALVHGVGAKARVRAVRDLPHRSRHRRAGVCGNDLAAVRTFLRHVV